MLYNCSKFTVSVLTQGYSHISSIGNSVLWQEPCVKSKSLDLDREHSFVINEAVLSFLPVPPSRLEASTSEHHQKPEKKWREKRGLGNSQNRCHEACVFLYLRESSQCEPHTLIILQTIPRKQFLLKPSARKRMLLIDRH